MACMDVWALRLWQEGERLEGKGERMLEYCSLPSDTPEMSHSSFLCEANSLLSSLQRRKLGLRELK